MMSSRPRFGFSPTRSRNRPGSVEVETCRDTPCVKGNPQRLEQVVVNLIQNACQSLPDRSKGVFDKSISG